MQLPQMKVLLGSFHVLEEDAYVCGARTVFKRPLPPRTHAASLPPPGTHLGPHYTPPFRLAQQANSVSAANKLLNLEQRVRVTGGHLGLFASAGYGWLGLLAPGSCTSG
jgi:hypothetical protein